MPQCVIFRNLNVSLLLLLAAQAFAHEGDDDSAMGGPGSNGVNVGVGSMIELGTGEPVQILISASYPGMLRETNVESLTYRYFMVSVSTSFPVQRTGDGAFPVISMQIAPLTRVEAEESGAVTSLRYFPVDVLREIHEGIRGSITVSAIGWSRYRENAIGRTPDEGELARMIAFAQITVDLLGIRLASISDSGLFVGTTPASVQFQGGLGWNLSRVVSLRVSLGGGGGASIGRGSSGSGGWAVLANENLFARLLLFVARAKRLTSAYFEAGYFGGTFQGPGLPNGTGGAYYLSVGVSVAR